MFIHDLIFLFSTFHTHIIVCLTNAAIFVSSIILVIQLEQGNQDMGRASRETVWSNILKYGIKNVSWFL